MCETGEDAPPGDTALLESNSLRAAATSGGNSLKQQPLGNFIPCYKVLVGLERKKMKTVNGRYVGDLDVFSEIIW